ncbi:MAG: VCBS repeat-containing protein [Polyangiales bacterium]
MKTRLISCALSCATLLSLAACSDTPTPIDGGSDARSDSSSAMDATNSDAAPDSGSNGDASSGADVEASVPDLGPCADGGVCDNDSRCVGGRCVPWTRGEFDNTCTRTISPGPLRPTLQCAWSGPTDLDMDLAPMFRNVLHTPLVANLGVRIDADSPTRPSIIFIADNGYTERQVGRRCNGVGVLRVIDGATCRDQVAAFAAEDRLNSPVTPAVGDIDNDGTPEIVAALSVGGLVAFRYDRTTGALRRVWRSRLASGEPDLNTSDICTWGSIALHDLDDDGRSEILFEGNVYDSTGLVLSRIPDWQNYLSTSTMPVIADVDSDDEPELVTAAGTYRWDRATRAFVRESYWAGPGTPAGGYVGVADFGDFPGAAGNAAGRPEVAVVTLSGGATLVRIQTIAGAIVRETSPPPGTIDPRTGAPRAQVGGPPTIADFNGDGRPDVGSAFASHYAVFSFAGPTPQTLWAVRSQDESSSRTGSSVFDFNGDGRAEVVYSDECFTRVYDGRTGSVVFSQPRFSSTWTENDVVADVDGDASAEIVSPSSGPCRTDTYCPDFDPIFTALRCDRTGDCPGGTCVDGYCRCERNDQCGDNAACTAAPMGVSAMGNVCRTIHRNAGCQTGIRVYRDSRDRWVPTRPVWNQHAYAITNVGDNASIPRSSAVRRNWTVAGYNNFMQNESRDGSNIPGADVTASRLSAQCEMAGTTRLRADVCNRGRVLLDRGIELIFRLRGDGRELCRLRTSSPIAPGVCTPVECVAPIPARGVFEAIVNPDQTLGECRSDNNLASGEAFCIG